MEIKHIKYPSIEQFRSVEKDVKYLTRFTGTGENGEDIFDTTIPLPVIDFEYNVKLHGTNAGVTYCTSTKEIKFISRNNILSFDNDNAGFCYFGESRINEFLNMFRMIVHDKNITNSFITIYGEFCGQGIQKDVGISKIPKSLFVFGVKITPFEIDEPSYWLPLTDYLKGKDIYNINDFETGTISIDFNNIEKAKKELDNILERVENRCPVAEKFLPDEEELIGEGIVLVGFYKNKKLTFKYKGEKHSPSKSKRVKKELTPEELERQNVIDICINEIFSIPRCNQGLIEIFGYDFENTIDIKKMGEYLKWVSLDTLKEEIDVIKSYTLEPKEVMKGAQSLAKQYFLDIYNHNV